MNHYEILNRDKHADLKVITDRSVELGDGLMAIMTFPMEFRDVQSCYPILFTKDPETGTFFAAALFGLERDQNAFLRSDGWDASYIPMMVRRQPFLIATPDADAQSQSPVVSIDSAHPRVNTRDGESLFLADGEPSEFLQTTIVLLEKIHRGLEHNQGFIETLLRYDLLEQITLDITLNSGAQKSLQGFYSIAEERLYNLEDKALGELNRQGYLQPIFMAVASFSRLRTIIDRLNAQATN